MIYFYPLHYDKGVRKLYQTATHVIDVWQENQLIALPMTTSSCGIGIRCVAQREKNQAGWAKTLVCKLTQIHRWRRVTDFVPVDSWPSVVSYSELVCHDLKDRPRTVSHGLFSSSTRVRELTNFRRSRILIIDAAVSTSLQFCERFLFRECFPRKISFPSGTYDAAWHEFSTRVTLRNVFSLTFTSFYF